MMTLIKETNMTFNRLLCGMALCAACVGCMSDPYIDESIAKLDKHPMHCKLPDCASVSMEPFHKEKLIGEWNSGVVEAPCRHVDGNGVYDSGWLLNTREYGFFSDGSFYGVDGSHNTVKGRHYGEYLGSYGHLLKYRGKWSYDDAVLTLNTLYYELEITSGFDRKVVSRKTESCNKVNTFIVTCYDNGEIAIEERDPKVNSSPSSGDRELVTIDNQGVRTERTVKVTGIRDGKEVGVVDEKIIPPMRFKREKNHE